jgi:hypothetical protein
MGRTTEQIGVHKEKHLVSLHLNISKLKGVGEDTLFIGILQVSMRHKLIAQNARGQVMSRSADVYGTSATHIELGMLKEGMWLCITGCCHPDHRHPWLHQHMLCLLCTLLLQPILPEPDTATVWLTWDGTILNVCPAFTDWFAFTSKVGHMYVRLLWHEAG